MCIHVRCMAHQVQSDVCCCVYHLWGPASLNLLKEDLEIELWLKTTILKKIPKRFCFSPQVENYTSMLVCKGCSGLTDTKNLRLRIQILKSDRSGTS